MNRLAGILACSAVLFGLFGGAAFAADPDELMPCKVIIIKETAGPLGYGLTKFVCKPPRGGSFALPSFPALLGRISVNTIPPGTSFFIPLASFPCFGFGDPPGSKGYKCTDYFWTLAVIKEKVVKAVVRKALPYFAGTFLPYSNDVGISVWALGAGGAEKRYCARFPLATALKNDDTQFKAKDATAPALCQ